VEYEQFLHLIERAAGIDRAQARLAAQATLETLGERISRGQARDLAAKLVPELAPWIATDGEAEPFDVDEFVRRVARRENVDEQTALKHVRAVFVALWQAVGSEELTDVEAELSVDYAPLLPRGPFRELVHAKSFYKRVAQRERLDVDEARRASEAVLETLAQRISKGEVEDLIALLPLELHAPLKRGIEHSAGHATKMSLEQFVDRVAERAGVDRDLARDYTRAVFATLREAVGDKEFFDMSAQLPPEYLSSLVG
jgi:uncharacterized protein (DUF2267 family)